MAEERVQPSNGEPGSDPEGQRKKPYVAPVLTEYGTIAKLTQGSSGPRNEPGGMRPQCL